MIKSTAGLGPKIAKAGTQLLRGEVPDRDQVFSSTWIYYENQDFDNTNAELTFFNKNKKRGTTNWPNSAGLPNDELFLLRGLALSIRRGRTVDGSAQAASLPWQADGDPGTVINELVQMYEHGEMQLAVAQRNVFEISGLYYFPSGGGLSIAGAINDTTADTVSGLANVNNGSVDAYNWFQFKVPHVIEPGDNVELTVRWPFNLDFTGEMVMHWAMRGERIVAANK